MVTWIRLLRKSPVVLFAMSCRGGSWALGGFGGFGGFGGLGGLGGFGWALGPLIRVRVTGFRVSGRAWEAYGTESQCSRGHDDKDDHQTHAASRHQYYESLAKTTTRFVRFRRRYDSGSGTESRSSSSSSSSSSISGSSSSSSVAVVVVFAG